MSEVQTKTAWASVVLQVYGLKQWNIHTCANGDSLGGVYAYTVYACWETEQNDSENHCTTTFFESCEMCSL